MAIKAYIVYIFVVLFSVPLVFGQTYEEQQLEKAKEHIGQTYWVCKGWNKFKPTLDIREDKYISIKQPAASFTIQKLIPSPFKEVSSGILELKFDDGEMAFISFASFEQLLPVRSGIADQDCQVTLDKEKNVFLNNPIKSEEECNQKSLQELLSELKAKRIVPNGAVWFKTPAQLMIGTDEDYIKVPGLTKGKILFISRRRTFTIEEIILKIETPEGIGEISFFSIKDILEVFSIQDINQKTKSWGKKVISAIKTGKVVMGMTKEQVIASWGKPQTINRSGGTWGIHEQWVYGDHGPYLYFENNKMTSWQD